MIDPLQQLDSWMGEKDSLSTVDVVAFFEEQGYSPEDINEILCCMNGRTGFTRNKIILNNEIVSDTISRTPPKIVKLPPNQNPNN